MRTLTFLALGLLTLLPGSGARAEEATLADGRRREGALTVDGQGRLRFTAADGKAVPLAEVQRVRWPAAAAVPLRVGTVHRVLLADGQAVTGQLLGFEEQLRLRTAWAEEVTIPRASVMGLIQAGGHLAQVEDDFESGLERWKLSASPTLTKQRATSGKHSLSLSGPGQAAAFVLSEPLKAGRIGVNFQASDDTAGARWLVEAEFQGPDGSRLLRVEVAGEGKDYAAEVPGATEPAERVPRSPGWHRLGVEFAADALLVTVDELALWDNRRHGPGGPLRRVRLACVAASGAARGEVAFDDFSQAKAVTAMRRPPGDPNQDEVWLDNGDQVFGRIGHMDRRTIAFKGRFGERTFPWAEVRGVFLRREDTPVRKADGLAVRLRLRPGTGTELDELEGVVRGLDDKNLTFVHPLLGEHKIDRGRLHELRPR